MRRMKEIFGRAKQLLSSTNSVCGSFRRGSRAEMACTLDTFACTACLTKAVLPSGAPRRIMPSSTTRGTCWRGSSTAPRSCGLQTEDLGRFGATVLAEVDRMRPLAGPCWMRMSTTACRSSSSPTSVPSSRNQVLTVSLGTLSWIIMTREWRTREKSNAARGSP